MTVKASMPMIEGGLTAMNKETDLEIARSAIPAHLSLMEGMLVNDPDNAQLHTYAAQGYYGYAFGFVEDTDPKRAAALYDRGYQHGLHVLIQEGLSEDALTADLDTFQAEVNQLKMDAVPALFWTASNWAKAIDINRDKARSLAQLPKAVMLMERVLQLDENFYMGGAHVFFGVFYGSKSPMLGGNYERSEQHFEKANQINSDKLLIVNLLRAQYLERQRFNQQVFHDLLTNIINASSSLYPEQALANQIARDKASRLLKKEEQWF